MTKRARISGLKNVFFRSSALTMGFVALLALSPQSSAHHAVRTASASSPLKAAGAGAHSSAELNTPNYVKSADNLRHWEKSLVLVYIVPSDCDNKTPDEVDDLTRQGIRLWNDKLRGTMRIDLTDDPSVADVKMTFVDPGSLAGGAIGRTDVTFRLCDQVLTRATIRINERLPRAEFVQVVAHEMGHALGIQGHSPDKRDLMFAYAHLPARITDRDFNTMATSYNIAPATIAARNANNSDDSSVGSTVGSSEMSVSCQ